MGNTELAEFRKNAVELSGGTSDSAIKNAVLRELVALPAPNSLLDYGAGRGELLSIIGNILPNTELIGTDFMERPDSLLERIAWLRADLNDGLKLDRSLDVVICSEVIEHLENPRATFRNLFALLRPGGTLILTMPNQESVRSYVTLIAGGHFAAFRDGSYPAHITALLKMDLARMCAEAGFATPRFAYTNAGGLPGKPSISWQGLSFGTLKGRLFSDNIVMVVQRPAE
jgi:2-polyprenyl-3-methyl-5-hydroxy-6-metoxy-1,4-benzoquinol methylase